MNMGIDLKVLQKISGSCRSMPKHLLWPALIVNHRLHRNRDFVVFLFTH